MGNMTACSEIPAFRGREHAEEKQQGREDPFSAREASNQPKNGAGSLPAPPSHGQTHHGTREHVDAETGRHGEGLVVDLDVGDFPGGTDDARMEEK